IMLSTLFPPMTSVLTSFSIFFITLHPPHSSFVFFFFNAPATTEIYTLSLHDALPIFSRFSPGDLISSGVARGLYPQVGCESAYRSEEHTSELQSPYDLVCRLLLEKKKKKEKKTLNNVI